MNKSIIIGRLAKDIEIKHVNGNTIGTITLIANNAYKNNKGVWVDRKSTTYISVFGERAIGLASFVKKGHQVYTESLVHQTQGKNNVWYTNHNLEELKPLSKTLAEVTNHQQPMDIRTEDYHTPQDYGMPTTQGSEPLPVDDDIPF